MSSRRIALSGLTALALAAVAAPETAHAATPAHSNQVLVLSVDGLHQSDLVAYVRSHPHSALAQLEAGGTSYTAAQTTFPSDSFPGMVAQFTGAGPGTSGVFYDDTYNPTLFAPGTFELPGRNARDRGGLDRGRRPVAGPDHARRRPGADVTSPDRPADQHVERDARGLARHHEGHPGDDPHTPGAAGPGGSAGEPRDLSAGVPPQLPQGQHRLQRRSSPRPPHRVVGQASGVRDPQRSFRGPACRTCSRRRSTAWPTPRATTGPPTTH